MQFFAKKSDPLIPDSTKMLTELYERRAVLRDERIVNREGRVELSKQISYWEAARVAEIRSRDVESGN